MNNNMIADKKKNEDKLMNMKGGNLLVLMSVLKWLSPTVSAFEVATGKTLRAET